MAPVSRKRRRPPADADEQLQSSEESDSDSEGLDLGSLELEGALPPRPETGTVAGQRLSTASVERYRSEGLVVLDCLLTPPEIAAVRAELLALRGAFEPSAPVGLQTVAPAPMNCMRNFMYF